MSAQPYASRAGAGSNCMRMRNRGIDNAVVAIPKTPWPAIQLRIMTTRFAANFVTNHEVTFLYDWVPCTGCARSSLALARKRPAEFRFVNNRTGAGFGAKVLHPRT